MECLHISWGKDGAMDNVELEEQWETENERIFESVIENMMWTKTVPRNYKYKASLANYDKFKSRMKSKLNKY